MLLEFKLVSEAFAGGNAVWCLSFLEISVRTNLTPLAFKYYMFNEIIIFQNNYIQVKCDTRQGTRIPLLLSKMLQYPILLAPFGGPKE